MKLLVMNVNHAAGISKKTGKSFDFITMTAFKPGAVSETDFKGMKPLEFFCNPDIFSRIPELPSVCDVEYELEPGFNGQPKMTVVGIKTFSKLEIKF
ncbi:hypothetical protein CLHUN_35830 [Ruminiclostridium hungatei]|uniref:Uncharacterized protein n=1 Tax=Ruminiclostridium hungatei TaxID=48256 RepID=A0A1V4SGP6_RUMHU|nr:hypothetical protein [Ruminiclostridium hungatei]OPX42447.1 hypothetical protein CLHUN_35720 [Ruminiclostridium hungatei]OPX42458.1 hypothetical protein CLHUN_35830 [Ruminiclostridium hungatei]